MAYRSEKPQVFVYINQKCFKSKSLVIMHLCYAITEFTSWQTVLLPYDNFRGTANVIWFSKWYFKIPIQDYYIFIIVNDFYVYWICLSKSKCYEISILLLSLVVFLGEGMGVVW